MMKNLFFLLITATILAACGGKPEPTDLAGKKAKLAELKGQVSQLNQQISALESEIGQLDTTVRKERTKLVKVIAVAPGVFSHYIDIQGKINAEDEMYVSPQMPGNITRIFVKNGDFVKAGQTIAELDDAVMQQTIAGLKTQLAFATDVYDRQKALWDQKIGTEVQYLAAKNNKEALEKQIATITEQWQMTKVKAPISGTIDDVMMKLGQAVAPGVPCVRMVNTSRLKIKADVAESFAGKVRQGNDVLVEIPDIDRKINSRISYVGRSVNPVNRTFPVEVSVNPNEPGFLPNMIAILKIVDYSNKSAFTIPVNLLQHSDEQYFVYVAEDKDGKTIAKRTPVTLGKTYNDLAEITAGLKAGDRLVTVGYQDLNEGELLEIQ